MKAPPPNTLAIKAQDLLREASHIASLRVNHAIHGERRERLVQQAGLMKALQHVCDESAADQKLDAVSMLTIAMGLRNGLEVTDILQAAWASLHKAALNAIAAEQAEAAEEAKS